MLLKKIKQSAITLVGVLLLGFGLTALAINWAAAEQVGASNTPAPATELAKPEVAKRNDDLARMVGTWKMTFGMLVEAGQSREFTPAELRGYTVTIDEEGTLELAKGNLAGHRQFVITLDPSKSPREMRWFPLGKDEDKCLHAHYDFDKTGALSMTCYLKLSGRDRPQPGAMNTWPWQFMTLERVAPKEEQKARPLPQTEFPAPPPVFAVVSAINKEKGTITLKTAAVTLYGARAATRDIEQNGKKVRWTRPITDFSTSIADEGVAVDYLLVTDAEGKVIEGDALWKRVEVGTMVLRGVRNKLDPAYRKLLSKDTLYFVPDGKWYPR